MERKRSGGGKPVGEEKKWGRKTSGGLKQVWHLKVFERSMDRDLPLILLK